MRTHRLTRAPKDAPRETVEKLTLDERLGVVGDHKSEKDGSVSLLSAEAEEHIRGLGGLCTAKFAANIVTDGLDFSRLITGTRLIVGGCELELTRVGKPCYEECAILQRGETCPIPRNCAFARVTRGGEIRTNDEINHKDTSDSSDQA
ncbi:MAG TPA: MOSC domain-containing protein [Clostridia bacterium]|nr:MOSC domain-containing protein [Clostridia bacterium]